MSETPEITDEQIRDLARKAVLQDIDDQMHDRMGLGEQLDGEFDPLGDAGPEVWGDVTGRLKNAFSAIRDDLARQWDRQ